MNHKYELINECIICLESNDTNNPVLNLNTFKKPCECDSYVHKKCLLKWYKYNPICPVCRISIHTSTQNPLPLYNSSDNTLVTSNRCNGVMIYNCCCYLFICVVIGFFLYYKPIKYHSHK